MPESTTPTPENTPPEGKAPEGTQPTTQDRINRITRQKHDALRQVDELSQQNSSLASQISELQNQVSRLTRAPAPAPPATPFGAPQQAAPAVAPSGALTPEDLSRAVADAVGEAMAPLTNMVTENQRGQAQQRAFSALAREEPALADPNSELHQAFSQIWDNSPDLQGMDNGLELAVYAARGALGSTPAVPKDAQKTAAAVTPPKVSPHNLLPAEVDDVGKAKELAGKLVEKGAQSGLADNEWEALLAAKLGASTPQ